MATEVKRNNDFSPYEIYTGADPEKKEKTLKKKYLNHIRAKN